MADIRNRNRLTIGMSDRQYILVTGNGRSGTNWMLDMLNQSALTHCRNEPNLIPTSPLHPITEFCEITKKKPDIADIWDAGAAWTAVNIGERDPYLTTNKKFLYPIIGSPKLKNFSLRLKRNKYVRTLIPWLRQSEWPLPLWAGNRNKFQQAIPVFKIINQDPRNIIWLLENRSDVSMVHIIRHPAGRLYSWLTRYVPTKNTNDLLSINKSRLHNLNKIDPEWSENIDNIDNMSLIEAEVWLWRYTNEKIHQLGRQHTHYKCVIYEELIQDPLEVAENIYDFCNIPFNNEIKEKISKRLGRSVWGDLSGTPHSVADAWKSNLSAREIDTVNHILESSLMRYWWSAIKN